MHSLLNFRLRAGLALLTMMSVAGCLRSSELVAERPQLPDIPQKLEQPCYDPGVASEANQALSDTRVAWAVCRKKHTDLVSFYKDVREGMQ